MVMRSRWIKGRERPTTAWPPVRVVGEDDTFSRTRVRGVLIQGHDDIVPFRRVVFEARESGVQTSR
jgi:hypothetical protein